jgi:heat-inducible transcriptional repressor
VAVVGDLTERQQAIATAVVAEHIRTAQPVGSAKLCMLREIECSPATVRNEMARLEEWGYFDQPHTSAGRVPLSPAYRLYVNELNTAGGRLDRDVTWVQGELRRVAGRPETALRLGSAILSRITRYPAIVISPRGRGPRLIDLSLTSISATNVLVSWLDDRGNSEETLIEISSPIRADRVAELESALREELLGKLAAEPLEAKAEEAPVRELLEGVRDALEEAGSGRVYVEGTPYILDQPEFEELDRLRRVMGTLSQSPVMRRALTIAAGRTERPGEPASASIGEEHGVKPLEDCSVVAASYSVDERRSGTVGVLGPMRMDYSLALEMVGTIARNLGQALARATRRETMRQ